MTKGSKRAPRICLACSLGGHLEQMRKLEDVYAEYERFLIIPREKSNTFQPRQDERFYTIADINEGRGVSNPVRLLLAFFQTIVVLLKERPTVVISTGAGVTIPAVVIARLLGIRTVYIESFARVRRPSKSGRVCYRFADLFFVQHEELLKTYPKARYYGTLYEYM